MTRQLNEVKPLLLAIAILVGLFVECGRAQAAPLQETVVAGGCFWCVESDFESVKGVKEAVSGFSGGSKATATYKKVTQGNSGHYEAVKISYDPDVLSYQSLVRMFLRSVDPTDANGQFCDRGSSYRTAIFVSSADERRIAEAEIAKASKQLGKPIVTPVLDAKPFYAANSGHQDYYKSSKVVLTRFGPSSKAKAYKRYRKACGRDKRVKQLWGKDAPFVN